MHQPFPSPPRTTGPSHQRIVSRALRETTKSKYMQANSPRLLDYPKGWEGVLYFRSRAVLGLPVSTIRTQVADRPRFNSADPPEPTTSLDNFKSIQRTVRSKIADC